MRTKRILTVAILVALAATFALAADFPAGRGGGGMPGGFAEAVEVANERLVDFLAAARADLQRRD